MKTQNDIQQIAKAKGRPMLTWVGKHPLERVEWYPAQEKEVYGDKDSLEFNKLFWGDNLQVLSHLLKEYRGKIDLIYIDPPFDSKADYVKKVKIRGSQVAGQQQSLLEEKQYTDIWENDEYLQFMYERLQIIRELISNTGCIYLHSDYRRASHLKLILDEVFGEDNFLNEIIWAYRGMAVSESHYVRRHDNIFLYRKGENYTFNWKSITNTLSGTTIKKYKYVDKEGRRFRLHGRNISGSPIKNHTDIEISWLDKAPELCMVDYLDQKEGIKPRDWVELDYINVMSDERTAYPTQKPEALLERFIKASSNEGDLILDCFCGSGTTLAVAQKLGRRWIGCDINIGAIQTTTKRLAQIIEDQQKSDQKLIKDEFKGLKAFKVLNVNDYDIFKNEIEAKEIVMEMYGVEPIKRSQFDGVLDNKFVKVMPLNRF